MRIQDIESTLHLYLCGWGIERIHPRDLSYTAVMAGTLHDKPEGVATLRDRKSGTLFSGPRGFRTFEKFPLPKILFNRFMPRIIGDPLLEMWVRRKVLVSYRPKYGVTLAADFFFPAESHLNRKALILYVGVIDKLYSYEDT